jgi:hydroxymethylbilane synthase
VIRIGTRKSPLAQVQTDRVMAAIPAVSAVKVVIESSGDLDRVNPIHKMERPGAFTHALTDAILDGRIDAAVHSLKDLPLQPPAEAPLVAILRRDDPADVILVRNDCEAQDRPLHLQPGSRVGTSAPRRQAQLLDAGPDLIPVDVRGNVETRLRLLERGVVDGLLMAAAGIQRLDLQPRAGISAHRLDPTRFPGCPGQGAIAVQARRDSDAARILGVLDDAPTRLAVEAERQLLAHLGGGCGLPLGAFMEPGRQARMHATFGHTTNGRTTLARWSGAPGNDTLAEAANLLGTAPKAAAPIHPTTRTVLLTLDGSRMQSYQELLAHAGWNAEPWSAIQTHATGKPIPPHAAQARWIAVTSPRSAPYADQAAKFLPGPLRFAAVGPATAAAMRQVELPVHVVAKEGTGASLAQAIAVFPADPCPVLVPQATEPAGGLAEGLQERGFQVIPWEVYATRSAAHGMPLPHDAKALVLTSPSAVQAIKAALPSPPALRLIAFGPTTAEAMRAAELPVHAICNRPSPSGVLEALS